MFPCLYLDNNGLMLCFIVCPAKSFARIIIFSIFRKIKTSNFWYCCFQDWFFQCRLTIITAWLNYCKDFCWFYSVDIKDTAFIWFYELFLAFNHANNTECLIILFLLLLLHHILAVAWVLYQQIILHYLVFFHHLNLHTIYYNHILR